MFPADLFQTGTCCGFVHFIVDNQKGLICESNSSLLILKTTSFTQWSVIPPSLPTHSFSVWLVGMIWCVKRFTCTAKFRMTNHTYTPLPRGLDAAPSLSWMMGSKRRHKRGGKPSKEAAVLFFSRSPQKPFHTHSQDRGSAVRRIGEQAIKQLLSKAYFAWIATEF